MVEDFATKAVMICDRGSVLYSGISQLGPKGPRMDEWIVKILSAHNVVALSQASKVLALEATNVFQKLPYSRPDRRHVFLIAGWQVKAGPVRQPVVAVVTNALDDNWNWLDTSYDQFRTQVIVQENPNKFTIASIGASVPPTIFGSLRRGLRNGFSPGIGPSSVMRLTVNAIRSVAKVDPTVGSNLLGVYVPPCNLDPGPRIVLASGPGGPLPTFIDIRMPFDGGTQHGPHFVCGGAGVTDVVCGSINSRRGQP